MEKSLPKFLQPLLKPKNALIALAILGVVIIGGTALLGQLGRGEGRIEKVEISGQGKSLIINENGIVEFHSGDDVYYQTLSPDRISALFAYIRKKVKNPNKNLNANDPNVFTVIVTIDGKTTTILIDINDQELQDILGLVEEGLPGEDSISQYFEDEEGVTPTPGPNATPPPTSAPGTQGPTPTPSYGFPPGVDTTQTQCSDWGSGVIGKAVISNTVCFKQ